MSRTRERRLTCILRVLSEVLRIDLRYSSIRRSFYHIKGCLRVIVLLSFFFVAAAVSSLFLVVVVVVVLVVGVVVVEVCVARVPLLQNAHRHVAVCIREHTASSSSCVSCSTTRAHAIVVMLSFLMTAHSLSYWLLSSTDPFFHLFVLVLLRVCGTRGFRQVWL